MPLLARLVFGFLVGALVGVFLAESIVGIERDTGTFAVVAWSTGAVGAGLFGWKGWRRDDPGRPGQAVGKGSDTGYGVLGPEGRRFRNAPFVFGRPNYKQAMKASAEALAWAEGFFASRGAQPAATVLWTGGFDTDGLGGEMVVMFRSLGLRADADRYWLLSESGRAQPRGEEGVDGYLPIEIAGMIESGELVLRAGVDGVEERLRQGTPGDWGDPE